jgi:membrane fusion protein (multidrug efflux system)
MKKNIISIIIIAGIISVLALFFIFNKNGESAEKESKPAKPDKTQQVQIVTVKESTIFKTMEITGTVEPYRVARLSSASEGPVIKLSVREGDKVSKDQVVAEIGRRKGAESAVASLKEELLKESENLKRVSDLVEKNVVPAEQLDKAKADYEKVNAQLIKATELLEDYIIRVPWEGIVSSVMVKEGEYLAPRTDILEIFDRSSLVISVNLPEKESIEIKGKSEADISFDAYQGKVFGGYVSRIYPFLDPKLKTRKVEISLKDKIEILPGMFARIVLKLSKIENAVVIPANATKVTPKGKTVVFTAEDGKAVMHVVETGIEQGDKIQIIKGIAAGDPLIISGIGKLKDESMIEISTEKPEAKGGKK